MIPVEINQLRRDPRRRARILRVVELDLRTGFSVYPSARVVDVRSGGSSWIALATLERWEIVADEGGTP